MSAGEQERNNKTRLTIFVSGWSVYTDRALSNLRRICDQHLPQRYDLEVVDVLEAPDRAGEAFIVATPTLVKQYPPPMRRVVGDLSDEEAVLGALDIETPT